MNTPSSIYKIIFPLFICLLLSSCNKDDEYAPLFASAISRRVNIDLYDYSTTNQESKTIEIFSYFEKAKEDFSEEILTSNEDVVVRSISFSASLPDKNDMEVIEEDESHLKSIGTSVTRVSVGNQTADLFCTFEYAQTVRSPFFYGNSTISIIKIECNGKQVELDKEVSWTSKFKLNLYDTGLSVE